MANESWIDDLLGLKDVTKDGGSYPRRAWLDITGTGATLTDDPITGKLILNIPGVAGSGIMQYKAPCRCVSTTNIALAGLLTIDAVILNANDRVLVAGQTFAPDNGIYVAASGAWTRATDMDASAEVSGGVFVAVTEGSSAADSIWTVQTNDPITIGVTSLAWKRLDSNDAYSLRGKTLQNATVGSPADQAVIFYDLAALAYKAGQIGNASILSAAAIAVSKLAGGTNGDVLKTVAGVPTWGSFSQADFAESEISPVISVSQNNYSPTGWAAATVVRLGMTTNATITSFDSVVSARRKLLMNISAFTLWITDSDVAGSAANRVLTPLARTTQVGPNECIELFYDTTTARWRVDHFGREFWNDTNLSVPFKAWLDDQAFTWTAAQSFQAAISMADTLYVGDDVTLAAQLNVSGVAGFVSGFTAGLSSTFNNGWQSLTASFQTGNLWLRGPSNEILYADTGGSPDPRDVNKYLPIKQGSDDAVVPSGATVYHSGTATQIQATLSTVNDTLYWLPLETSDVPSGASVTGIHARFVLGGTPSTEGPEVALYKQDINGAKTYQGIKGKAALGTGTQDTSVVGSPVTIDHSTGSYYLAVFFPVAGSAISCQLRSYRIQFDDPGPRNY